MRASEIKKETIISKVSEYCSHFDYIELAYLYGSFAEGTTNKFSDIDIAIKTEEGKEIKTSSFGLAAEITADLMQKLNTNDIDVILLNNKISPLLKKNAVIKGELVYSKQNSSEEDYRERVLNEYLDFKVFKEKSF